MARITERHEAPAQTVEIISGMQRANEDRLGQLMDTMNLQGNIAHEQRLDHLENR